MTENGTNGFLKPLTPDRLFTRCNPKDLPFKTTNDLEDLTEPLGQDRAVGAVRFGIGIRSKGFNMFCLGPEGTGKMDMVRGFLATAAKERPVPDDWCYVQNFKDSHKPKALCMPPGRAEPFRGDMETLVKDLQAAIPAVFEGDEYRNRKQIIEEDFKEIQEHAFRTLQKRAAGEDVAMMRTPVGLALAPMKEGEVLSPEEFSALPKRKQTALKKSMEALQKDLEELLAQTPKLEKDRRERIHELNREATDFAVGHLIEGVKKAYTDIPAVLEYLDAVRADVVEHVDDFVQTEESDQGGLQALLSRRGSQEASSFRRYRVNVLVDHGEDAGAPVVHLDHPTQPNLVGRIDHLQQFGALLTDFNLIKPGALHRANGGYLVIDARMMLMLPFSWEDLKRALRTESIKIEPPGQAFGFSTVSLDPEPIPLNVKVILVGEPMLYYLLCSYDPDFEDLFKVPADFDTTMDRGNGAVMDYARMIAGMARKEDLRPLKRDAVARVIEHSARLADDGKKLTTHMTNIADLIREADYWAGEAGRKAILTEDVQKAVDTQLYRVNRIPSRMREAVERDIILIDTDGEKAGQVNGLAVYQLGRHAFGQPSRITARVRVGKGEVLDIEREVQMGGPIHSKGVMILSSFLSARYATDQPLSLSATLVFEQSYGGIEGDSASSTELYAILSALADAPIKQGLAVTGSVNQFGQVQAIGGVNEKIEGFFELCKSRGLTGRQGVLIPAANVTHLMLRPEIVEAVAEGQFAIYPVETIDQGIELLTGVPAGTRNGDGEYPSGTVNRRVAAKLDEFTRRIKAANADLRQKPSKDNGE